MRVWDLETEKCTDVIEGHVDEVVCLRFSEQYIVSGSKDNTIKVPFSLRLGLCVRVRVCARESPMGRFHLTNGWLWA